MSINKKTFQESGYKYGIVLYPKDAGFIIDKGSFDTLTDDKRDDNSINIVDYDYFSGLCVSDIKDYKKLIYDNKIVFVMYDRIEYSLPIEENGNYSIKNFREQAIRYYYVIDLEEYNNNNKPINNIIGNKLDDELRNCSHSYPLFKKRAVAFLEKYYYKSPNEIYDNFYFQYHLGMLDY